MLPRKSLKSQARVLFVDNDVNSFYSYRIEMARAARDAGFDVHIACPPGKAVEILLNEGFTFHPIPMTRSGLTPWKELGTIVALFRLYRKLRPDLVHHLRLKPVLYGGLAAYGAGVPAVVGLLTGLGYVFTAETRKAIVLRKLVTWSCKVAFRRGNQRVIFQNPDDRFIFVENRILPAHKTVLIKGSGVNVKTYLPTPEPDGVPVVLLAARMLRDKGVVEFVEAARSLRAAGVRARFALVGETDPGNPTAISADQLRQWADSGDIEWWGLRGNMQEVLAQSHIVCLPSLREGVPKVLIEAAACGRAIVTTDAPGCREIVRHGENGLLVPVRDSRALAAALRLLIENAALRAGMGLKGREIVVEEFSVERVVNETLGVYRELLPTGAEDSRERNFLEQGARLSRRASGFSNAIKRSFDFVIALVALLVVSPILLILALIIKLGSAGPVFYRGVRIGRHGVPFRIFKFRTMVIDAEKLGGSATAEDDPRITPIGRFIRRNKLDEFPQFLNVLVGDMSLVGPRPEVKKYVDMYTEEEKAILELRPGITDWASIWNSNEAAVLEGSSDPEKAYEELIRPTKLALQLFYARNQSLVADVKILFHTFCKLLFEDWTPRELLPYGKVRRYKMISQLPTS